MTWWGQVPMDISIPRKTDLRKPLASLHNPTWLFWTAQCQGISHTPQREKNVGRENADNGNSPSAYRPQEKLEFPWESPGFIPWRSECPVSLGTRCVPLWVSPQWEEGWKLSGVCIFPDGPYPPFVWDKILGAEGPCLKTATDWPPQCPWSMNHFFIMT